MGIRLAKLQHSAFGGPITHQINMLSDLRNQVQALTKERNKLKELGLTIEDRKKIEAQLAEPKLENSKLANDLLKATEGMQQLKDRVEAAEGEVAFRPSPKS